MFQRAGTGCAGLVRSAHPRRRETGAPDEVYDAVARHFDPTEVAALTLAITTINTWNRLNVGLRVPSGGYVFVRQ